MLRSLAVFSVRHRWLVLVAWLLLAGGGMFAGQRYGGSFSNDLSIEDADSQHAYDTLRQEFPRLSGDGMQVVIHDPGGVTGTQVRATVEGATRAAADVQGVATVTSPYGPGPTMVSADGRTAVATVRFEERAADIAEADIGAAQRAFAPVRAMGVQVEFGGAALDAENHPSGSEVIGLTAAVLVLLLAFGSVFAMLVPLLTAVLALGVGMGTIFLLTDQITIGTAGPVVAAMIGLGVGIDYALLVVTRHREEMATGSSARESIPTALSTAGRSVLVAGTTVIVAILSLYAIGIPFVATLGLASAITVASTLLAAVTLLPALLGIFGDRLDRYRVRASRLDHGSGRVSGWHRWTRHVQRRPWPYLLASVAVLATLAVPLFDLRLGTADDGSAPKGSTERAAYELIARDFGPGWTGPLVVTSTYQGKTASDTNRSAQALAKEVAAVQGVEQVTPPVLNTGRDAAVLTVVPTTAPDAQATEDLVHRLRGEVAQDRSDGAIVHVGGATATNIDLADKLAERMPWFMGFVVGLSLLLLLVEFRSIFVPVKAALMNLLSVAAAYGAVVAVFQWGWLSDLFGAQPGPIESFAPMMLFAVLFGLSMDYEVFLLSRVREEYLRTGRAGPAVADGIAATARVITAAASVMVVVFASFLLNDDRVVNLFGFGLAVAIAIDATIVRLVLVPALMALAGRLAWYMPHWLDRLVPRVRLDGPSAATTAEGAQPTQGPLPGPQDAAVTANAPKVPATYPEVADQVGAAGTVPGGNSAEAPTPDAHAALTTLQQVIADRDGYRQQYLDAHARHQRLSHEHEQLLQALRTVQAATGAGNGSAPVGRAELARRVPEVVSKDHHQDRTRRTDQPQEQP
jgi:RND superfamily putative drug exporter